MDIFHIFRVSTHENYILKKGLDTESESFCGKSTLTIVQISTMHEAFLIHWQRLNHYDRNTIESFYKTLLKKKYSDLN